MLRETIRLALHALRRNLLRSFLTVLGVVIGVAAVIAMVTVGQGSSRQVTASVESLGSNVLILVPEAPDGAPGDGDGPAFRLADAAALANLSAVEAVAPILGRQETVVLGSENHQTMITGTANSYLEVLNWPVRLGRVFTSAEERSGAAVCLIGETVRRELFGLTDPTGEKVRVRGVPCTVVGLLAARGASSFGGDQDDVVLMPIRTVQRRLAGTDDVSDMRISLAPGVSSVRGIREIEALMRERRKITLDEQQDFEVIDTKEIASILTGINTVLTGLLSSVAAVSLLVGGIGIMNIMLVSVTERTREIGIRLAIGAQAGQVRTQFLVEAVVLSVAGGVIGILLGLAMAFGASRFMAIPFSPSPLVVLLAFGFSALVGVLFGYVPARNAARLDPIEALRHQ